jgi:hypothetical protein
MDGFNLAFERATDAFDAAYFRLSVAGVDPVYRERV